MATTDVDDGGLWAAPLERATFLIAVAREAERPFTTSLRPRDVAGTIIVSCEHREGQPCASGVGAHTQLDSSIGYSKFLSASVRLRLETGTDEYATRVAFDRAYLHADLAPIAVEVGRDTFVLGPSNRTQLAWGDHSPPLDHIRVSTAAPWRLAPTLQANGVYVVGRLRDPQSYAGNLVSIARGQLDIADTVEIGLVQNLQLGGMGAAPLGFGGFLLEHFRRADPSASSDDSSNRRFGGDVAARIRGLYGARFYYAVMFEDIRRARFVDALRYDADHLVGVELAAIGPMRLHGVTLEWHQTGVRSQEHTPRRTGFTNGGYVVGAPLGPDASSLYAGVRIAFESLTLYPWLEVAQLSSDTYEFIEDGPINRTTLREDEARYRVGARMRIPIRRTVRLEGAAVFEHIDDFAFESGVTRNNAGFTASIIWYPQGALGRIELN